MGCVAGMIGTRLASIYTCIRPRETPERNVCMLMCSIGISSESTDKTIHHPIGGEGGTDSEPSCPIYDPVCVPYFRSNSCPLKVNRDRIRVGLRVHGPLCVATRYMSAVNIGGKSLDSGFHSVSEAFASMKRPSRAVSPRPQVGRSPT